MRINVEQKHIDRWKEVVGLSFSENYCCPIHQAVKDVVKEEYIPNVGSHELILEKGTQIVMVEDGHRGFLRRGEEVATLELPASAQSFIKTLDRDEPVPFSFDLKIGAKYVKTQN